MLCGRTIGAVGLVGRVGYGTRGQLCGMTGKRIRAFFGDSGGGRGTVYDPLLLNGRKCLVTNCDLELPAEVARSFAKYGASVLVHATHGDLVQPLVEELRSIAYDSDVIRLRKQEQQSEKDKDGIAAEASSVVPFDRKVFDLLVADLDDPEEASQQLAEQAMSLTHSLDVLVHNAGELETPPVEVLSYPLPDFDHVVRLNLTTPFALVQRLLPLLEKGSKSSIIFTSTDVNIPKQLLEEDAEENAGAIDAAYYVSKFGVRSSGMLTKMLANELQLRSFRVNSIDPGRFFQFRRPEEIPAGSDRTVPFVWLARPDTMLNGAQIDVKAWLRRDPRMYRYSF